MLKDKKWMLKDKKWMFKDKMMLVFVFKLRYDFLIKDDFMRKK
jgi:hypothetical protein